jgi:3,4-dihydroxy 2-butanone 4-phosphate synthase/GTP cyclohydrolase II
MEQKLNTIEEAIAEIRAGKIVIVVDDEDRENEGDFIAAAESITPEIVNFMTTYGRGLVCAPILESMAEELNLDMMVGKNTDPKETAFTISIDLLGDGVTTGISASDRAKTLKALTNPSIKAENFSRPGHVFPLKAKENGVIRRAGHTEAAIDLARLAGLQPVAAICEIMNEDGSMSRLPQLFELAERFQLKIVSIKDLIAYRIKYESLISKEEVVSMPTEHGNFMLHAYKQASDGKPQLALVKGEWEKDEPILVRVHSSCVTGDIFGSCKCDCGPQLHESMKMIEKEGKGIILYMNQEGRGIGLLNKLKAYHLQEQGVDTVDANLQLGFKDDERDYGIGAQILRDLNATKIRLLTNNLTKKVGLISYGIEIVEVLPLIIPPSKHNIRYLTTKQQRMGHDLHLAPEPSK